MRDTGIMTTLESVEADVPLETYVPLALERCDAGCGAAALVRVVLKAGNDLVFCRHDYFAIEARLAAKGAKAIFAEIPK